MAAPAPHRVLVVGALGRMGHCVREALAEEPSLRLSAALEAPGHPGIGSQFADGVEVLEDAEAALARCDVVIDFSQPAVTLALLRAAADARRAFVTGTTGLSEAQRKELAALAQHTAVLHAPNFSVAVNVLAWLTHQAAAKLGPGYDAEIVELHHAAKRDAPSGTALALAEAVAAARGVALGEHLVLERAGETGARPEASIGVQALRGGDNPGEHTVLFLGRGERLELVHRSATRDHFARGAVRAAAWLVGRAPGLYRMDEVLGLG
ncbi:MAG: 4-hydroxy-tetrahydrodipicolinate reductase [Myxococcales bacterium]|nr:4-hydroxy-tetrahydrodipicolinate reductase [Myxococcales bacterium]MDH5565346.1 4-hydroxy-tetrahydrodipicolinate reductase [Myxococcales bacterium]